MARAEAEAARIQADAAAYAERATAGAQADANRSRAASLADGNQELIAASRIVEALPALVAAAAQGIAASNLTILNGTEGVNQVVAGLVGQGLSILDTLKKSTAAASSGNGPVPAPPAEVRTVRAAAAEVRAPAVDAAEVGATSEVRAAEVSTTDHSTPDLGAVDTGAAHTNRQ